jgi:enoyl-CoA hydratase/carnithine racemase
MTGLFAVTPHGDCVVSLRIADDAVHHLDPEWLDPFLSRLATIGSDPSVRAVILEGGTQCFCAGASRDSLLASVTRARSYAARVPHALLDLPVPVVAAMAGHAIGGGLVLGLWCDAAVLAAESLYGANFMALGFTPGMGATCAVPEAFGAPLGRELLWTGRLMTGREIRDAGCPLSHAVVPRDEVFARALSLSRDCAATSRDAALRFKQQLAAGRRAGLEGALAAEDAGHELLLADPSLREEIARRYAAFPPSSGADASSTPGE